MMVSFIKKHWPVVLLYIAGLLYTFATLSSRFDGDFGWQLRFGKDWLDSGFPYLDTYTFSYYGRLWINHEWGGSLLWWSIYRYIGYNALVLFVAIVIWTAFALIPKVFRLPLTALSLLCSLLGIVASNDILYTRLTVIAPAFFLALLFTLERVPEKKYYYWWPVLIWIWAALHGSWILAFIVIGIYVSGKLLERPLARVLPITYDSTTPQWNKNHFRDVVIFTCVSAIALCLNPYGFNLWHEVLTYFSQNYYVRYITEWQAAYVYPILIIPLIVSAIGSTLIIFAFLKKKITLSQLLLFLALQYAAFSHKRNIIYAMLVSVPLFYSILLAMRAALGTRTRGAHYLTALTPALYTFITVVIVAPLIPAMRWHTDVWQETAFLESQGFPARATAALHDLSQSKQLRLFNQFRWGGFFNWQLPQVPVYIDGRGTVSWSVHPPTPLYQEYRTLIYENGGLATLEGMGVNAVLLEQPARQFFVPDTANKVLFSAHELSTVTTPEKSELEKSLERSQLWRKVYTDSTASIWLRSTP